MGSDVMICNECGSYNKDGMPGCFNCMVGGGISPGYPKQSEEEPRITIRYHEHVNRSTPYELAWRTFAGIHLSRNELVNLRDEISELLVKHESI